ncbi:MAG TPA: type II pantothenate kinase [Clostridiales bacterium]|nr:type II pantothenate kinase [Clostridiales bacterium]
MRYVIGIDVGGSTTKTVGFQNGTLISPIMVKASDPKASLFGGFGKFLEDNRLKLDEIERVMVTGVGSSILAGSIYGIPAYKVDEFRAIGKGGLFLSGLHHAIVVSMGTGTAIVAAGEDYVRHIGGTGVGGGTLLGLSNRMLNIRDFNALIKAAEGGSLHHVDLFVNDLTSEIIHTLPDQVTASNFGRISDLATPADIAMGIINLVLQTIGVTSAFASHIEKTKDIVLTGTLTGIPYAREIFNGLESLHGVTYTLPEHAEFATSVGAALCKPEETAEK